MIEKCNYCGELEELVPIIKENDKFDGLKLHTGQIDKTMCKRCVDNSFKYGFCRGCGEKLAYHLSQLNSAGECLQKHAKESL